MTATERKLQNNPHQPVGRWIRVDKRLAIYLRDRFTCTYCRRDLHGADPAEVQLDHIVCQSTGPRDNSEGNLVTACRSCNTSRKALPVEEFASGGAMLRVQVNTRTDLAPFRDLARRILSGDLEPAAAVRVALRKRD